jgi:hypothetical protein
MAIVDDTGTLTPQQFLEEIDRKLRAAIVQRYRAGETMEPIAKSYGIGWKKVREVLRNEGVRIRNQRDYAVLRLG